MRIDQLEHLAAVTEHGSLRRAAEHLHLSQSALSASIRGLERELGVTLLERHRAGARVSEEGQDLLPIMAEVLGGVAQLRDAARHGRGASRTLRVGTVHAGTSALVVPAAQEFSARHRATTIDVATMLQAEIQERLLEGRLEVGLVNVLPGDDIPAALEAVALLAGRPVVCCRTDDALAGQESISVDDLREWPYVSSRPGYLMHRLTQRLFGSSQPRETFSADGADMAKLLVANGAGAAVLPDYSIHGDPSSRRA
ncbi:LysR family transcriptional regulator [Pimelobacter simplex]|uniref:LysR family transcriptional regulator n=1 Tax=Nocardioides simplex TaxID=2045 RepID=UPI001C20A724|nr:LysR family transcriptional regulator [Pimelobacter simplex]